MVKRHVLIKSKAIVYPPQKRTISFKGGKVQVRQYYLQLPYILFLGGHERLRVAFSDRMITSPDDTMYRPALGNIYKGSKPGSLWYACGVSARPGIEVAIGNFWSSVFTREGGSKSLTQMNIGGLTGWEEQSKGPNAERFVLYRTTMIQERLSASEFLGRLACREWEREQETAIY